MAAAYPGPLRDEPLAIELHNTIYATGRAVVDGLADAAAARAWLDALASRLPAGGGRARRRPSVTELVEIRDAVRAALHAAVEHSDPDHLAPAVINAASARAPRSPVIDWRSGTVPVAMTDYHGASRADVILAAFAADATDLLTGPRRDDLRACGAPGCVLMFLRD